MEVQTITDGTNFAIAAVALALIDAGVVEKGRFLVIAESIRTHLRLEHEMRMGSTESAEMAIESLTTIVAASEWAPGEVLECLQDGETAALAAVLRRRGSR